VTGPQLQSGCNEWWPYGDLELAGQESSGGASTFTLLLRDSIRGDLSCPLSGLRRIIVT
jgi:hypothetical protein